LRSNVPALLKQRKDRRQFASAGIYVGVAPIRQNPGNILEKPAAGDMGEALDSSLLRQREESAHVDSCGLEQDLAKRPVTLIMQLLVQIPSLPFDDRAHEREAVAVNARAGETENDVARLNARPGQHLVPVDGADAETGEIVIARGIYSGHF